MEADTSRRARKRQATRDAMHAAAIDLFLDRGLDEVTVEEIAERADVAASTFFRHFATKEDAVMVEIVGRFDELEESLRSQPAGPIAEMLRGAVEGWRETRRDLRLLRAEVDLVANTDRLRARFVAMLLDYEDRFTAILAAEAAPAPTELQARLAAAWFLAAVRVALRQWALDVPGTDPFTLGMRLADLIGRVRFDALRLE